MYNRVASNRRKTWALLLGFGLFVALIGGVFGYVTGGGWWGLPVAMAISLAMAWAAFWESDRLALAVSRARPADAVEYRQLHNIVEALAIGAGLPAPRLYIIDDPAPNAFATGRNPAHGAIAVTTGLLQKMNRDELEGVLAHELSHIKNRDTLVMTVAVVSVGVIVLLSSWLLRALWWGVPLGGRSERRGGGGNAGVIIAVLGLLLLIVAPIVARIMQFAISRRREYLADADAVLLTRYPDGLIAALQKLHDDQTVVRSATHATAHLWIESALPREPGEGYTDTGRRTARFNRFFDTHPPLEDRIAALRQSAFGGAAPRSS